MKSVIYCGNVAKDIKSFECAAKQRMLRMLDMLRLNLELHPKDFKYIGTVGDGVYELKVKTDKPYRVFYIAKFEGAIYVLHAFVKKTKQTERKDIEKGRARYKALLNENRRLKKCL